MGVEKTAAAEEVNATEEADESDGVVANFGSLVGEYFSAIAEGALEKNAFDVSGVKGVKPQASAPGAESALGSPGDPAMEANGDASSGAKLSVTTGGASPYTLKGAALKAVLKRMKEDEAVVGSITQ